MDYDVKIITLYTGCMFNRFWLVHTASLSELAHSIY